MAIFVQLIGQVGSGKSYVAKTLASALDAVVLPFAAEVYRLARLVKGSEIDKGCREDRELLKIIGTNWGRQSLPVPRAIQQVLDQNKPMEWGSADLWAQMFVKACQSLDPNLSVVNDDTRFVNELELSMGLLGFIPMFVWCTEQTRLARLRRRGEKEDPGAKEHASEELASFLSDKVLINDVIPVIWNEAKENKPELPWVYSIADCVSILTQSPSNAEVATKLGWDNEKASAFIETISAGLTQSRARTYAHGE